MSQGGEPAMDWECGWTRRQELHTTFWWRNTLENNHLEDQGYGCIQSKWISDLKRWTQLAQDRGPWRVVAFSQIRRKVKPKSKISTSSPTNLDCHETWQVYPTPVDLYPL